jgi:hypothetical protein
MACGGPADGRAVLAPVVDLVDPAMACQLEQQKEFRQTNSEGPTGCASVPAPSSCCHFVASKTLTLNLHPLLFDHNFI